MYISLTRRPSSDAAPTRGRSSLVNLSVAQVRLDDAVAREQLVGLGLLDAVGNDDVLARDPVNGRGHLVLVAELQRVDDAQHLGGVAARRGRVGQDGADLLGRVDEEDGADGQGAGCCGRCWSGPGSRSFFHPRVSTSCSEREARSKKFEDTVKERKKGRRGERNSHVVEVGHLAVRVRNDGELDIAARHLGNVLDPAGVPLGGVGPTGPAA